MKSFTLLRTNVGLTTNVKIVVGSDYSLFLDSIVSSPELADTKYKKFQFNKDIQYDDVLPTFFQSTPVDVAYKIKFDLDDVNMSQDFANQYDDLYSYGARNIIDNKFYSEEYEYFAPIHINKNYLPSNFIIFRIDGPGLISLNKDNFRQEIINKLKFVSNFDLSLKTKLGQWINKSIISNTNYPNQSLFIDFRKFEFSSWKGIDYDRGGYSEKNFLLDSVFQSEQPLVDMEKFIFDGYKNNKVIYPNILNFSFLFDDTPATKDRLRKWSLNRYLGFYFDELTLVNKFTPNKLPKLHEDVIVDKNNILYSPRYNNPFVDEWKDNLFPYLEIDGIYYPIEKFEEVSSRSLQKVRNTSDTFEEIVTRVTNIKYKIISEISLTGKTFNDINRNVLTIDENNNLLNSDGQSINIVDFDSADVWIMEIGDKFHNIVYVDGFYTLNTDYGFKQSDERFDYYINDPDPNYRKSLDLITKKDYPPIEFNIYKCKFTDLRDFDLDFVETEFSKFEYIKKNELTDTDEPKMFVQNLQSTSSPKDLIEFRIQNQVTAIPSSSEYTSNSETFRITQDGLNILWRKNAERVKWGYLGSLSSYDYPYLLNNSFIADDYNRTSDTSDINPRRDKRNLDHFYTINSNSSDYSFHSLHVEDHLLNGDLNTNFKFDLKKYLGIDFSGDYFSYFFGKRTLFQNGEIITKTKKYSTFQSGDTSIPNVTLFRGIKFKISEIENINIVKNKIEKINLKNSNKFEDWNFSVLMSQNDHLITSNSPNINDVIVLTQSNVLRWQIIDEWKQGKDYATGSLVLFNESLYYNSDNSMEMDPNKNPSNSMEWLPFNDPSIFYSETFEGFTASNNIGSFLNGYPPIVYNSGEYYYSDGLSVNDFWKSNQTYQFGDVVTYNNKNWQSIINNNTFLPSNDSGFFTASNFQNAWGETDIPTRWSKVELWDSDKDYSIGSSWNTFFFSAGDYVLYDNVVYGTTYSPNVGIEPPLDPNWTRVYSMVPDTNYLYNNTLITNNIIFMNGKYYRCLSNEFPARQLSNVFYNFTLDNGIYVIINEKYKNILINIYINDNTYSEVRKNGFNWDIIKTSLSNTNRDDIYTPIFSKLTSNNLMNCLNDLSNNFGFSDKIKYIVVSEDSTTKIYDFNDLNSVGGLPYLLTCDPPNEFFVKKRSLVFEPITLNPSEIKANKLLNESNIDSLSKINWYNEMPLASKITNDVNTVVLLPNYSGLKNDIFNILYRHSGYYTPITKEIQLFDSFSLTQSQTNYKFDTNLNDFGLIKQRIVSKVNRNTNLLKLRNNVKLKSYYPMLEEFGYHLIDSFIFKSTWDFNYHYETQTYQDDETQPQVINLKVKDPNDPSFRNNNINLL